MTRFIISTVIFAVVAAGVGLLLSGEDEIDWGITLGLFGIALAGEGVRTWIRRRHSSRRRQSSEI